MLAHNVLVFGKTFNGVLAIGRPVTFSMTAMVIGHGIPTLFAKLLAGLLPGVACLPAAMRHQYRPARRVAPGFGSEHDVVGCLEGEDGCCHADYSITAQDLLVENSFVVCYLNSAQ